MKFLSALVSLVAFSVVQAMPVRDAITGANPAAIYCVEIRGGTLVKQTTSSGDVDTVCSLPNGNQTEQWALFRADPLAGCKVMNWKCTRKAGSDVMALEACHTEFASCKGETNPLPQLGNPAAQYCYFVLGNGLRKIQHAGLGESENCIMKDGIEIDEWELYFSDKLALCKVERYWCLDAAETDNVDTEICNSEYVVCSKGKE